MAAAPTWESVYERNSVERIKRDKPPLGIREELPALIAAGYERDAGGGHRPPPVVGPLPRQAEDRHLHAAREDPERDPRAGEAARDRRGLEPLRPRRRGADDAAVHPASLARARGAPRRLRRSRGGRASRAPAAAATPCATSPAARSPGSPPTSSSTRRRSSTRRPASSTATPTWANLPRKHKYSIASCADRCNAPEINCVSLVGVVHEGREGFAVQVGGGLASVPRIARDLGVFVPKEDAIEILGAVTTRVERGPEVPHVAREGAPEVHGRRHRRRRDARARRGEARPHARALRAAADRRAAVGAHRRARAEAGRALVHRRPVQLGLTIRRPADRRRRSRRVVRRRHPADAPAEPDRHRRLRRSRRRRSQQLGELGLPLDDERDLGQLDRLHRRAALQLLRRRDEGRASRRSSTISRRRSATQVSRAAPAPRRLPARVRAALGRRPRLPGDDRQGRRRQPHLGLRHLRARLARARCRRSAARSSAASRASGSSARSRASCAAGSTQRADGETFTAFQRRLSDDELGALAGPRAGEASECERRQQREHVRAARRAGGRRAVDRVRGRGAAGAARVGDRASSARASRSRPRSRSTASRSSTWRTGSIPNVRIFSVDTGRLPRETHELIDALRAKYPGLNLQRARARPGAGRSAWSSRKGLDLMTASRSRTGCSAATCARCSR